MAKATDALNSFFISRSQNNSLFAAPRASKFAHAHRTNIILQIKCNSDNTYTTENDTNLKIKRCTECGTSIFWELDAERFKGMTATAGGTFDPPMPWTQVDVEFFTRSKAPFCSINAEESFAESPHYKPVISEDSRLDGN